LVEIGGDQVEDIEKEEDIKVSNRGAAEPEIGESNEVEKPRTESFITAVK